MVAIIILDMTTRYKLLFGVLLTIEPCSVLIILCSFLKNVDAGKAKELMASLVNLQSSIPEVNKYVFVILYQQNSLVKCANSTGLFLFIILSRKW